MQKKETSTRKNPLKRDTVINYKFFINSTLVEDRFQYEAGSYNEKASHNSNTPV